MTVATLYITLNSLYDLLRVGFIPQFFSIIGSADCSISSQNNLPVDPIIKLLIASKDIPYEFNGKDVMFNIIKTEDKSSVRYNIIWKLKGVND